MQKNKLLNWVQVGCRHRILALRTKFLNSVYGMQIHPTAKISFKAHLDKRNSRGMIIGEGVYIAFGATLLAHDMCRNIWKPVTIEKNCHVGCNCIILPGVTVGESSIVAAGAVVTKDVPPHSVVAGNPAKIVKSGVKLGRLGIIKDV